VVAVQDLSVSTATAKTDEINAKLTWVFEQVCQLARGWCGVAYVVKGSAEVPLEIHASYLVHKEV